MMFKLTLAHKIMLLDSMQVFVLTIILLLGPVVFLFFIFGFDFIGSQSNGR